MEYCSKGDLKSFLTEHQKEFNDSLKNFNKMGLVYKDKSRTSAYPNLDMEILHRWIFQVDFNIRAHKNLSILKIDI